jgi:hypothetical protein
MIANRIMTHVRPRPGKRMRGRGPRGGLRADVVIRKAAAFRAQNYVGDAIHLGLQPAEDREALADVGAGADQHGAQLEEPPVRAVLPGLCGLPLRDPGSVAGGWTKAHSKRVYRTATPASCLQTRKLHRIAIAHPLKHNKCFSLEK